jgi:hypothetical protein
MTTFTKKFSLLKYKLRAKFFKHEKATNFENNIEETHTDFFSKAIINYQIPFDKNNVFLLAQKKEPSISLAKFYYYLLDYPFFPIIIITYPTVPLLNIGLLCLYLLIRKIYINNFSQKKNLIVNKIYLHKNLSEVILEIPNISRTFLYRVAINDFSIVKDSLEYQKLYDNKLHFIPFYFFIDYKKSLFYLPLDMDIYDVSLLMNILNGFSLVYEDEDNKNRINKYKHAKCKLL